MINRGVFWCFGTLVPQVTDAVFVGVHVDRFENNPIQVQLATEHMDGEGLFAVENFY